MQSQARRVIQEAKSSSWQQFCTSLTSNTNLSKVWKVIKSFSGHRSSYFIPTLHVQDISAKNKQHKSNMLANQFALSSSCTNYPPRFVNVTLPIQTQLLLNAMSHRTSIDPGLNQAFTINELLSAINDTKNTTPGPDNICYEMFNPLTNFISSLCTEMSRPKCPVTETTRPNRPDRNGSDRNGQTEMANRNGQTESPRPKSRVPSGGPTPWCLGRLFIFSSQPLHFRIQ